MLAVSRTRAITGRPTGQSGTNVDNLVVRSVPAGGDMWYIDSMGAVRY